MFHKIEKFALKIEISYEFHDIPLSFTLCLYVYSVIFVI